MGSAIPKKCGEMPCFTGIIGLLVDFWNKRILNVDNDELEEFMKSDEKVVEIDKTYNQLVNELVDNLFYLIIKWNHDNVTNIELK